MDCYCLGAVPNLNLKTPGSDLLREFGTFFGDLYFFSAFKAYKLAECDLFIFVRNPQTVGFWWGFDPRVVVAPDAEWLGVLMVSRRRASRFRGTKRLQNPLN